MIIKTVLITVRRVKLKVFVGYCYSVCRWVSKYVSKVIKVSDKCLTFLKLLPLTSASDKTFFLVRRMPNNYGDVTDTNWFDKLQRGIVLVLIDLCWYRITFCWMCTGCMSKLSALRILFMELLRHYVFGAASVSLCTFYRHFAWFN